MPRFIPLAAWSAALLLTTAAASPFAAGSQLADRAFLPTSDHPAIAYSTTRASDVVEMLNRRMQSGEVTLDSRGESGYLRAVLDALHVPIESQMLVFSKTSFQASRIDPSNPRALYFNDSVAVGWVRGGFVELAALDPRQGMVFYTLDPTPEGPPVFTRRDTCLICHESRTSLDIPGTLQRSVFTAPAGQPMFQLGSYVVDHRTPLDERWGGWYVTGTHGAARHMGNAIVIDPDAPEASITGKTLNVTSLEGRFDPAGYPSAQSDIVALLVFGHQMHMANLIARTGWEARVAAYERQARVAAYERQARTAEHVRQQGTAPDTVSLDDLATELVDYLLFIDEAPLSTRIQGRSRFADVFTAQGPFDRTGRSLRQLQLDGRLMRYPCSYMIYSDAFDALPHEARDAIYRRLWRVLSGDDRAARYQRLSLADRQAIVEILIDTKQGLPDYFAPVTQ